METEEKQVKLTPKDRRIRMLLCNTLAMVFGVLALLALLHGWRKADNILHASKWPKVEGKIVAFEIDTRMDKHRNQICTPEVKYSYEVDGVRYEGNVLSFSKTSGKSAWAQDKAKNYPVGKIVPVSYKTGEPSVSVLEPAGKFSDVGEVAAPFFILFVILSLLAIGALYDHHRVKNAHFDGESYSYGCASPHHAKE